MNHLQARVTIAGILYILAMALYLFSSAAPLLLDAAFAFSLFVGFVLPSFLISEYKDLKRHWKQILMTMAAALLCFDILFALIVAKSEFMANWAVLYPFGLALLAALLLFYTVFVSYLKTILPPQKG